MAGTVSNPTNDRRSLTHAFHEIGSENGERRINSPDVNSPILLWTCPRKFSEIRYAGGNHVTKFVPRTKQTFTGTADDDTEVALDSPIQPINGETDPRDQPYAPVVAANTTTGEEIDIESYDYTRNEVVLAEDPGDGEEVALWPILSRGTIQYRGLDQFNQEIAPVDQWSEPVRVFHDFDQNRGETEIHLVGSATWNESETMALYLDSPDEIVWEDEDYPGNQFASTIEQRVDVTV